LGSKQTNSGDEDEETKHEEETRGREAPEDGSKEADN